ncbi:MAG: pseudouridine synthase [Gaiellales bacterium]
MAARLNQYLASTGVASRRASEQLIRDGRVTVNGEVAGLAVRVGPGDEVCLDGRPLQVETTRVLLLHKPAGVITTARDTHGRRTVVDLVPGDVRLFPVGRLDRDTTGALLLTNDGGLAHRLMHPRHGVPKTYLAEVRGRPPADALDRLRRGVELEDGMTAPAEVELDGPSRLRITIHEGRNRQVRRMCEAVGHPVLRLHRACYATLGVDDLDPGEWRTLTDRELERLRDA